MRQPKFFRLLVALIAVFALFAAACGDDSTDAGSSDDDTSDDDSSDDDSSDDDSADDDAGGSQPGEGVSVTMARADWQSGYIQADIYRQLVSELGYDVSDPADIEIGPSNAYTAMAAGDFDFWTNSWYPGHLTWHENELPDGTLVGDHVEIVDGLFARAGVQGFLITKTVAEEHGITSMQQIHDDPELTALFDYDGDGKATLFGCQESFTCDDIITNQLAFYGWDNFEQEIAGYDALFAEFLGKVSEGEPALIYTWTPSSYVTQAVPGDNVLWLTMHPTDVLDDSNPVGTDGGEFHDQRPGFADFGEEFCTQPCQLGWVPADIQVTANSEFLGANPVLKTLFEQIRPSVIDISIAQVDLANSAGTQADVVAIATAWVEDNRELVDGWLDAARASA
jgi:glycine betaine/proline transport system substrate-binding protein